MIVPISHTFPLSVFEHRLTRVANVSAYHCFSWLVRTAPVNLSQAEDVCESGRSCISRRTRPRVWRWGVTRTSTSKLAPTRRARSLPASRPDRSGETTPQKVHGPGARAVYARRRCVSEALRPCVHPAAHTHLNGKVERSHRIADQEFYQLLDKEGITDDIHLFNEKLREWEDYYNYHRPHGALDGQTPYNGWWLNQERERHRRPENLQRGFGSSGWIRTSNPPVNSRKKRR